MAESYKLSAYFYQKTHPHKNSIRALLDRQDLGIPKGRNGWSQVIIEKPSTLDRFLDEADDKNLWRGQLYIELEALVEAESHIAAINSKLEILAKSNKRVAQLRSIPGVGLRLAAIYHIYPISVRLSLNYYNLSFQLLWLLIWYFFV